MAYQNIRGTTYKSFKIGPNGVSLSTIALANVQSKKIVERYLATNQPIKDTDRNYALGYIDPDDRYAKYEDGEHKGEYIKDEYGNRKPLYDTVISTNDIASIGVAQSEIIDGVAYPRVVIRLKKEWAPGSGNIIYLYSNLSTGNVSGPNSAKDGSIPIFDGTSGKIIKDSGRGFVDTMDISEDLSEDRNIPSVGAVYKYIGDVSDPLVEAISGTGNNINN